MKKILFVATVSEHFYCFHLQYFKMFKELGWQVDVASHGDIDLPFCDNRYEIPFSRSPFDKTNVLAYNMLKTIIKNNNYDIIHCHTPMGGVLARMAAKGSRKNGTKVIYTAHGFHFYKGAPLLNWLMFYPVEFLLSYKTDCIITINSEDFNSANKHLHAKESVMVNGVGYNSDKFFTVNNNEKIRLRNEKGYSNDDKILIYVAELNANKNQGMLIKMMGEICKIRKDVRLLLVGPDNYNGKYKKLAEELNVSDNVEFLGRREDIDDLLNISDVAVGSSLREGLPVNIMESLACGLPVVLADNRGHRALVKNGFNGFLVDANDYISMSKHIVNILDESEIYNTLSENAVLSAGKYSKEEVMKEMREVYKKYI